MQGDEEPAFTLSHCTVAIVGLGLMGGSLALALKQRQAVARVIGISRRRQTLDAALALRAVDEASDRLEDTYTADLIVLGAPVRVILDQIPRLGAIARDGALLLDMGSSKRAIVAAMDALPPRLAAVGGHPMCGKETSGFDVADAELYQDKVFVLTPTARSSPAHLALAAALARAVGSRVVELDAAQHDQVVAAISHLPYLAASNLVATVDEWNHANDSQVWQLAASGFRDTSRVAASETDMMLDILLTNRENVAELVRLYSARFAQLAELLQAGDEPTLRALLERAAIRRREWGRSHT